MSRNPLKHNDATPPKAPVIACTIENQVIGWYFDNDFMDFFVKLGPPSRESLLRELVKTMSATLSEAAGTHTLVRP